MDTRSVRIKLLLVARTNNHTIAQSPVQSRVMQDPLQTRLDHIDTMSLTQGRQLAYGMVEAGLVVPRPASQSHEVVFRNLEAGAPQNLWVVVGQCDFSAQHVAGQGRIRYKGNVVLSQNGKQGRLIGSTEKIVLALEGIRFDVPLSIADVQKLCNCFW